MTLRDQLLLDLPVFLCTDEFAEELVLDGVTVTAVRDDDLTIQRTAGSAEVEGVWANRTVLHLEAGLIDRPVEGQRVTLSGERWYVRQVSEAEGMLELTLERQES